MTTLELVADCSRCSGLCCVAPAFSASADFAVDKPAGVACPNLQEDFGCSIHSRLRPEGFAGCTVYDCFGAGQHVTQQTFGGQDWRSAPELRSQVFAAFEVMRDLHELLWYLTEAIALTSDPEMGTDLRAAFDSTQALTQLTASELLELDVQAQRSKVNGHLVRCSEQLRSSARGARTDHRGADLIGADLTKTDLIGADLRGALLIGADLRMNVLHLADVTGADLRGADLRGADLSTTLFLTQAQLDAARGDALTRIPPGRTRPSHW